MKLYWCNIVLDRRFSHELNLIRMSANIDTAKAEFHNWISNTYNKSTADQWMNKKTTKITEMEPGDTVSIETTDGL